MRPFVGARIRLLRPCGMGIIPRGAEGTIQSVRVNPDTKQPEMVVRFQHPTRPYESAPLDFTLNVTSYADRWELVE